MTQEEYTALIQTAQYKFYKDYVEPLEKAHDSLLDENTRLREQNVRLNDKNQKLLQLVKQYRGY